jgi:hypothetical protein
VKEKAYRAHTHSERVWERKRAKERVSERERERDSREREREFRDIQKTTERVKERAVRQSKGIS